MSQRVATVAVVGAGIFGVTAALELARRGHPVTLLDRGPLPHPRAASFDVSRLVRVDYGADEFYTLLAERAVEGWERWNRDWPFAVYHPTGVLIVGRNAAEGFERASFELLQKRGHHVEWLDGPSLEARFPAWSASEYSQGYFNATGGWVESVRVLDRLLDEARVAGVRVRQGWSFGRLSVRGSRVMGLVGRDEQRIRADAVVLATGAWLPAHLPELADRIWPASLPVIRFRVEDPVAYAPPGFPPWAADVAVDGWTGFPVDREGFVKVVNLSISEPGGQTPADPDGPRDIPQGEEERFRAFLRLALPGLAGAPVTSTRMGLYCETFDGDFWIDRHPALDGLVVAAGGSAHAFKFAPVLGGIIADIVERRPSPVSERFGWRNRGRS